MDMRLLVVGYRWGVGAERLLVGCLRSRPDSSWGLQERPCCNGPHGSGCFLGPGRFLRASDRCLAF